MKRIKIAAFVSTLICSIVWMTAAMAAEDQKASGDKLKQQAEESFEAARKAVSEQQEAYRKKLEMELGELSKQIGELKDKAAVAQTEASRAISPAMAELRKRQAEAEEKLKELRGVTARKWEAARYGAEKAVQDLRKAYELIGKFSR